MFINNRVMESKIEVEFYRHCDDGSCSLGYAEFKCPSCGELIHEYGELWWIHDSPKEGDNGCESYCRACKTTFLMEKTKDYNSYIIKIK